MSTSTPRRFSLPSFKPKKKAAAASSSGNKRSVTFQEKRNTFHDIEFVNRNDMILLQSLWQQSWEMRECKDIIRLRAKQWRQTGMGVFLSDVFHCDNNLSDALCQQQLNTFTQLPDEMHMRGCERYLSRKHDEERSTRKRTIIREVVTQFRTLQAQVKNKTISQSEAEDVLSKFARRLNQDAETFAHRIAKADEAVVQFGTEKNTKPAMEMVELKYKLALEHATAPPSTATAATATAAKGQLKKAPPAAAQQLTTGRQLQARQA